MCVFIYIDKLILLWIQLQRGWQAAHTKLQVRF